MEIVLPTTAWQVHGTAAAVSVLLAGWLWTRHGESRPDHARRRRQRARLGNVLVGIATVVAILAYAVTRLLEDETLLNAEKPSLSSATTD